MNVRTVPCDMCSERDTWCEKCWGSHRIVVFSRKPVYRPKGAALFFAVCALLAALAYVAFTIAAWIHGGR